MLFWEFSKTLETTIFQDKYSEHLFLCPREDRIKNIDKKRKKKREKQNYNILESTWEYEITKIDKYINKINKTIKQ